MVPRRAAGWIAPAAWRHVTKRWRWRWPPPASAMTTCARRRCSVRSAPRTMCGRRGWGWRPPAGGLAMPPARRRRWPRRCGGMCLTLDFAALADAIAREAGAAGWCGLSGDGALTVRPTPGNVAGHAGRGRGPLPPTPSRKGRGRIWVTARDGRHFLGSPIDVAAITAAVGCVQRKGWRPDGLGLAPGGSQRRSGTDDPSGERTRTDHDHRIRHRRADRQQRPAGTASRLHRAAGCVARAERIAACAGSRRQGPAGQPARSKSRTGSRRRRGRHAGPALSGWRRPPHRVRSRRRRYQWLRCSRP